MYIDAPGKANLAKIRHGLRTPVNHIIGYAEILMEEGAEALPAAFLTDLEKIRGSGHILLALINRYLGENRALVGLDFHALSHELRTPVNHIIGYGELLAEQCDKLEQPQFRQDLAKIVAAAHTWLELMEEHFGDPSNCLSKERTADRTPIENAEKPPRDETIPRTRDASLGSSCRGHLLVVDDNEANQDLLRRHLEKLGYTITTCGDGLEALRLSREIAPDIVLLDVLMPNLDGHEVLVRMKSDEKLRHVPVIMISALDQVTAIARCIELGAEDYLAKPFDPILLRSRVEATLEKRRLRESEQMHLRLIEEERARSDRLLLNILPQPIANRLKSGESRIVNIFDEASVIFADLVGFTTLATKIPPTALIHLLDQIFSAFDELADQRGMEKIKTIGDAYMAVAGVPFPHYDHAAAAARMALDMHVVLEKFNRHSPSSLEMRIGICTGPVIAGVIGQKKFIYDLWGDTVNTASRMESHGLPGKTQVTATTYELLRDRFRFERRGFIEIKGKGKMETYFLCPE